MCSTWFHLAQRAFFFAFYILKIVNFKSEIRQIQRKIKSIILFTFRAPFPASFRLLPVFWGDFLSEQNLMFYEFRHQWVIFFISCQHAIVFIQNSIKVFAGTDFLKLKPNTRKKLSSESPNGARKDRLRCVLQMIANKSRVKTLFARFFDY